MSESDFLQEVVEELTVELNGQPTFNHDILELKVKDAYRKVKSRKCYQNTSKTNEQIIKDLYDKHLQDIKDLARYNFATMGADFETSHSENGISRIWRTEDEILGNISAYVGFL